MAADLSAVLLPDRRVARLTVEEGRIAAVEAVDGPARAVALPLPVDPHLHLDKTYTAQRCRASEPGLFGAIAAMERDKIRWTEEDLRARMGRALGEIRAAGYGAVRSHVDWPEAAEPLAWRILAEIAEERAGLAVQRAALVPIDLLGDPEAGPPIAARVAETGGVLGAFVYRNEDLAAKLGRVFSLAERYGLRLDFHVDEGLDPEARGLDLIADLTARSEMSGRVLCGHACSLSVLPEEEMRRSLDTAARAGLALTVMPTTNLHLQDMSPGRSPRRRGLAPMQEGRSAGLSLCLGIDNVRDPFYPHGAYDPMHVLRLAVLAAQLAPGEWLDAITTAPARAMGLPEPTLAPGAPANLLLIAARDWNEAVSDPRVPVRVIRAGRETDPAEETAR
ncbi:MAG TPA: amidohydrolase family protein [Rubellimicrobium sp.]|nr:amidohydrolase family protein [Rubellimicrobium sp.]